MIIEDILYDWQQSCIRFELNCIDDNVMGINDFTSTISTLIAGKAGFSRKLEWFPQEGGVLIE